jgi:hypothetical protein
MGSKNKKMSYGNILEEELKNKIAQDYFVGFDGTKIIGKVDFCITLKNKNQELFDTESLLWAEAKKGKADIYKSIAQLILTIGKARTFDKFLPPAYLGAFDAERIGFIPYNTISDIFYINDFNWSVTPSNHETKEFLMVLEKVKTIIDKYSLFFNFDNDKKEIKEFIATNFIVGKSETSKIKIDKNNFLVIYSKWLISVRPTIEANWDKLKSAKKSILDCDFYLADLLSRDNISFKDNLSVVLNSNIYRTNKVHNDYGGLDFTEFGFSDNQKAYKQFWNKYERPPNELYWDYILERRELLVPQDVRERKGSYFTPQIWVELSQKYLTDVLGENWQDEYYIWDCAAGTGNLLAGLTNKYNIFASTLDKQDVDVMKDRIQNGANILEANVFQFDFLNDSFDKLPKELQDIINNPEKRKKLVIYINPPYAEAANYGNSKDGVSSTKTYIQFKEKISFAVNELFSQFFARIYHEIPDAKLASFSTMKYVTASNYDKFRNYFNAGFEKGFICKANTFDNVKGNFPIGFLIWNLENKKPVKEVSCDITEINGKLAGTKTFNPVKKGNVINDWLRKYYDKTDIIGHLRFVGPDFQANSGVFFTNQPKESDIKESRLTTITKCNIIQMSIYLAVRQVFKHTWINHNDQFLFPNEGWKKDKIFQNDCLTYTIFNSKNKISSKGGVNYWIPFTEYEVDAKKKFESNFMNKFMAGKINVESCRDLFEIAKDTKSTVLIFSTEARAVFNAGKELYKYYHKQKDCNVNASLYDIREYFQGRNIEGRMNNKSEDVNYNKLNINLRDSLELLELKLQPKIYEFGFLKK